MIFLFSILLVLISLTACAQTPPADLPTSPDEVPRISIEELLQKMEKGANIVIVDTRSETRYHSGHIKGAISVPYTTKFPEEWELPSDKEIIFYCT